MLNSFKDKYEIVLKNIQRFAVIEQKYIQRLGQGTLQAEDHTNIKDPQSYMNGVRLQTYYKCCIPAIHSIEWLQEINYKVINPFVAVVAFKTSGESFHAIDSRIATWVHSGGTRIIPLKIQSDKDKIIEIIKNTHALIVPQFQGDVKINDFQDLCGVLKENSEYPVLALGNSAIMMMSILNNTPQICKNIKFNLKFHNAEIQTFVGHQSNLFKDLDLKTRLQVQNRFRVVSSSVQLPLQMFLASFGYEQIQVVGIAQTKIDDFVVAFAKQNLTFYGFIDPRPLAKNLEGVSLGHKLIINFMQQVRKRQKKIDQSATELSNYKTILKQQRFLYNIDLKLPKI